VRAVQSPATLFKRCEDDVQSPRTPCGDRVYFKQAQNKRRGLAFAQRAVCVVGAPRARCKDAL